MEDLIQNIKDQIAQRIGKEFEEEIKKRTNEFEEYLKSRLLETVAGLTQQMKVIISQECGIEPNIVIQIKM